MQRPEPVYRALGETVRRLRRERDQSQDQLAGQIGLSRSALANIEAGHQRVAYHHFLAIAQALRIEPAELLPKQGPAEDLSVDEQLVGMGVPESAARAVAKAVRTVMSDATTPDRPHRKSR